MLRKALVDPSALARWRPTRRWWARALVRLPAVWLDRIGPCLGGLGMLIGLNGMAGLLIETGMWSLSEPAPAWVVAGFMMLAAGMAGLYIPMLFWALGLEEALERALRAWGDEPLALDAATCLEECLAGEPTAGPVVAQWLRACSPGQGLRTAHALRMAEALGHSWASFGFTCRPGPTPRLDRVIWEVECERRGARMETALPASGLAPRRAARM